MPMRSRAFWPSSRTATSAGKIPISSSNMLTGINGELDIKSPPLIG